MKANVEWKVSRRFNRIQRLMWMKKKTSYRHTLNPVWISNSNEYHLHMKNNSFLS